MALVLLGTVHKPGGRNRLVQDMLPVWGRSGLGMREDEDKAGGVAADETDRVSLEEGQLGSVQVLQLEQEQALELEQALEEQVPEEQGQEQQPLVQLALPQALE
jgi:hypothetical protein